jgi:hypothetical protein
MKASRKAKATHTKTPNQEEKQEGRQGRQAGRPFPQKAAGKEDKEAEAQTKKTRRKAGKRCRHARRPEAFPTLGGIFSPALGLAAAGLGPAGL